MSVPRVAFLGVLSLSVGVWSACGGNSRGSGSTTGSGGGGTTSTTTTTTTPPMDAGPDVDHGMPSNNYPAPFPAPPRVVSNGGAILGSPRFVPVFFSNDDPTFVQQLTDFDSQIGGSKYWVTAVGEYGVGAGTAAPAVELTETAPATIDDSEIQTWLAGKLNGDDPAWPANDGNTVYVLHYPAGTTITVPKGGTSCQFFGGYHSSVTLDAAHGAAYAAYAVIPRCDSWFGLTGIDAITVNESHELAEAATDPHPFGDTAYLKVDDAHFYWSTILGGGEVADLCARSAAWHKWPGLPFTVQSIWSNAAAKAGHDRCQPSTAAPYFAAVPVLEDVPFSYLGQVINVKAIKLTVGASADVEIDLFSDGPTSGPFTVEVVGKPYLDITLDKNTGVNGEKLHATITVLDASPDTIEIFTVTAKLDGQAVDWLGMVFTL